MMVADPRRPGADPGIWVEAHGDLSRFAGRPALFLDRDGVINEDGGYVGAVADVRIIPAIVPAIAAANAAAWPVVVVTNQSGIARGYYGWDDFAAVSDHIDAELRRAGARLDLVLACGYHDAGGPPLAVADHPMRKPNPGMFLEAARLVGIDVAGSVMVGDRASDFIAAARAGVRAHFLAAGLTRLDLGELPPARPFGELLAHLGASPRTAG